MIEAVIGLAGVLIGSFITIGHEIVRGYLKRKRERVFVALVVVYELEKMAKAACTVGFDNGFKGQPEEDGSAYTTTDKPTFNPRPLVNNWDVVDSIIVHEIFDLSREIDEANDRIQSADEYGDGPPDYKDFYIERQKSYARIGISAFETSTKLRRHAGLPERPIGNWDIENEARKTLDEVIRVEKNILDNRAKMNGALFESSYKRERLGKGD